MPKAAVPPALLVVVMITAVLAVSLQRAGARTQGNGSRSWAEFGVSVAAVSETIFVAASPIRDGKRGPGSVHVFQHESAGWVRADVLPVPEATVEDLFGLSMAAEGDTLVVGAHFADARGNDSGQAYVFERRHERWHQAAVLSASDAASGDQFGLTVSVSGETIVVGARLADSRASNAGAAYVFTRHDGSWQQVGKLTASDTNAVLRTCGIFGLFGMVGLVLMATLAFEEPNSALLLCSSLLTFAAPIAVLLHVVVTRPVFMTKCL